MYLTTKTSNTKPCPETAFYTQIGEEEERCSEHRNIIFIEIFVPSSAPAYCPCCTWWEYNCTGSGKNNQFSKLYTSAVVCTHCCDSPTDCSDYSGRKYIKYKVGYTIFRQHAALIYGFVRQLVCQKKFVCLFVGLHCGCVPPCKNMCVCSFGYIVGASPPSLKTCVSVRWVTMWVRPPPPPVCPF